MKKFPFALVLLLSMGVAQGASKFGHETVEFDPQLFEAQRQSLIREIRSGERYAEIGKREAEQVLKALDEMAGYLHDIHSISELRPEQAVEVFNRQELVNALLTDAADDSRLICTREMPVGSHRPTTTCKTALRRQQESLASQEFIRKRNITSRQPDLRYGLQRGGVQ